MRLQVGQYGEELRHWRQSHASWCVRFVADTAYERSPPLNTSKLSLGELASAGRPQQKYIPLSDQNCRDLYAKEVKGLRDFLQHWCTENSRIFYIKLLRHELNFQQNRYTTSGVFRMWESGDRESGGRKSPSGVQGQSPSRRSGGRSPSEADAYLLMNAQILTFWRNKLVKQSWFRHYTVRKKIMVQPKGGHRPMPPP